VTSNAITTSVAEKTGHVSSVGNNRAYSDGGSGKDKCGNNTPSIEGRGCSKKPLCYKYKQRKKLLCMQRIWAHSLTLQKQRAKNQGGRQ